MANPDPDRKTGIGADQISDGTIGPFELATTNEETGSAEPQPDEVLHGHDETGSDRKLKFKRAEAPNIDVDNTNFDKALYKDTPLTTLQETLDYLDEIIGIFKQGVKEHIFFPGKSTDYGNYAVSALPANSNGNFSFTIPQDFNVLVELKLLFIPVNTIVGTQTIDISSEYGQVGEISSMHSESDAGLIITGTADYITSRDISSIFSNLAAGDACGLNWKNNNIGTTINVLAIELRYT